MQASDRNSGFSFDGLVRKNRMGQHGLTTRLGVRYSTSLLVISTNRLARRPPAKTTDGRREAAPRCFVDEGGRLAKRFALIANNDVE